MQHESWQAPTDDEENIDNKVIEGFAKSFDIDMKQSSDQMTIEFNVPTLATGQIKNERVLLRKLTTIQETNEMHTSQMKDCAPDSYV